MQGGEGHQGQLAIRREEEAAGLPQQGKQGLEGELVERLGRALVGGVPVGQGIPQARGGEVDGLGGAQVEGARGGVREEHQRQVARPWLGSAGAGHERAVHVGDELDEGAVRGQGLGDTVHDGRGRGQRGQRAQGRGVPGELGFEGIPLRGELLELLLVGCR